MRDVTGDWRKTVRAAALVFCALLAGCAGGGGGGGGSTCAVDVAIEPAAATVTADTTQPFVATVTGVANTAVTWSVQEGASGGTVSNTGVYTAPSATGTYHVVATSQGDSCGSNSVAVTVVAAPVIAVSISPVGQVTVRPGGSQTFFATVTGTANTGVTWDVQGTAGGSITSDGVYTADQNALSLQIDQVIATSVADPSKSSQVVVMIESVQPIVISPTATTVGLGGHVDFTLSAQTASGGWSVDGIPFGNTSIGTINALGVYTAPYQMPTSTTAVTAATITNSFTDPGNSASVTWASRFLSPETIQVDACVPQCAVDIPNAIVAADFNGDGFSDLATANSGTGTVSLLISSDESHFAAPYRRQVGDPNSGDPQALATGDLNQDGGVQDLVIADADPSGEAVRSRLGVGNGTFGDERSTALPSNSNPLSIAVADFDTDPHLDVAVANFLTNTVDVLRGVGDGSFQSLPTITGLSGPLSVATADFNIDGWYDLAVANNGSDTVSVFLSNGDGTFVLQSVQLLASNPSAVAVVSVPGTLNGDNFPDLVVTTTAPNGGLTVIFNTAAPDRFDPRFNAPDAPIATGSFPVAVATGNFNRDSVPDVVVANQGDNSVSIYLFDAANDELVLSETYEVGNLPQALAVGDFNGDGWPDVAVANSNDDTVSVLRNRGGPTAPP